MKHKKLLILLLGVAPLLSYSASAVLMRDNGPEPIIVQIKESLRLSDDLDSSWDALAQLQQDYAVTVQNWWAGQKLLELVTFSNEASHDDAIKAIKAIEDSGFVDKVVTASAVNLEFKPGDFGRQYPLYQDIPEAARRGLDKDEWSRVAMSKDGIEKALEAPHVPNQIIVRWKSEFAWKADQTGFLNSIAQFHASTGAHVVQEMTPTPTDLTQVIDFNDPNTSEAERLAQYIDSPWVDYAEPNSIYEQTVVVTDPYYYNPGQPNLPQIKAPSAWVVNSGNHDFVVAVADTGANVAHPDFSPNLSSGARNFVTDPPSSNVDDDNGHGSNVASIIGAKGNNALYMTGVAHSVSLLHLKVLNALGSGTTANGAAAIDYAYTADQGHPQAIAINLSFALPRNTTINSTLQLAVRRAQGHNMVVVAAAANENLDCEVAGNLVSPACIPTDNVIAVGATRIAPGMPEDDEKLGFSNYGRYRIEMGAPGGDDPPLHELYGILGLRQDPNGSPPWKRMSGTSQAAPHVTGAVQLVKSKYPWENYAGLRDRVLMGTDDVTSLSGVFRTSGRLNLFKTLQKRTLIRNISTRAKVESGDRIIIGGFTIGGASGPCGAAPLPPCLKIAIRGLGPSLPPMFVSHLNDPKLQLNNSAGQPIYLNEDWGSLPQSQKDDLAASGLTPTNVHEAAMVQTLAPGSYTVFVQSQDGQQGVALFELYELSGNTNEQMRLRGLSTRCPVGVGDEVAIAGTVTGEPNGNGNVPKRRLLMFGKGPSLEKFGVPGVLTDPKIELRNSAGGLIDDNDQWRTVDGTTNGLEAKLEEAALAPGEENESALWPHLAQGTYTAILQGTNNSTGIGLIEFLEY